MQNLFTTRPPPREEDSVLIGVEPREPPSIISSTTSSNASVSTNSSASALFGNKVRRYLRGAKVPDRPTQKELNILLAGQAMEPTKEEMVDTVENQGPKAAWGKRTLGTQVLAAVAVSMASLVVGFSSAYTGSAVGTLKDPDSQVKVTETDISWIGSLMPLFASVGGICGGPLIEGIGRRNTILLTGLPFILAYLLISFSTNVGMIYAGRMLIGLSVGIGSLAYPVYLGETIEPRVRGTLGILPTTLGNLGILLAYAAGSVLKWPNLALLGACLPVAFMIATCLIPETPLWHISRGDKEKAEKSLQWLRGKDADISEELKLIIKAHKDLDNMDFTTTMTELFSKTNIKPFFISIGLMVFQQFSGINAVIFYSVAIFKDAGSTIDSNLSSIIVGVVNLASTLMATFLVDRLGRKILLYIADTLMAISLGVLAAFFYYKQKGYDMTSIGWVPLVAFVVFIFAFSIGAGPIPWLMMGEILPAKVRGAAASIVTSFNWISTFIVTKSFVDINDMLGSYVTFSAFTLICCLAVLFTIRYVPETQGKTLEEIEEQLTGKRFSLGSIRSKRGVSVATLKPLPSMF